MVQLNFDASTVAPASVAASMLPVSDGNGHLVVITKTEGKPTKDNSGGFLELSLQIIEGQHQGATGAYRLNLWNNNPQTVEIAHKQLSALCHVTGKYRLNNSDELCNVQFRAIVDYQKRSATAKPDDPVYTEVKGVKDVNGNDPGKRSSAPTAPAAAPPAFAAAPAAAPAAPAWTPAQPAPQAAPPAPAAWAPPSNGAPVAPAPAAAPAAWSPPAANAGPGATAPAWAR